MKIRIQGNSLRLRLSQPEVRHFGATGRVEEAIRFGPAAGAALAYVLQKSDVPAISATLEERCITVWVPEKTAAVWTATEQVGFEGTMPIAEGTSLRILVEKDFQCLDQRPGEDEGDNFPNPKGKC